MLSGIPRTGCVRLFSTHPWFGYQEILESIRAGYVSYVINTRAILSGVHYEDGIAIRRVATQNNITMLTSLDTIGSLTKTFTAAMISKAVQEEKIDINATIDQYLTLPEGNDYPTIEELLTHTSGYKAYYFESPMIYDSKRFF